MTSRNLELALWIGACAMLATAGVRSWHAWSGPSEVAALSLPPAEPASGGYSAADAAVGPIAAADPFRVLRHPSPIAYRPELEGVVAPPPPPKPPHPVLVLVGILGGPPWDALLDGVPGHEGSTLVHAGQVIGELRVRTITRDSVVVQGADTTWHLGLKRSWQ